MNLELLYKLLKTPSPSGYELEMQKMIIEEMKDVSDKVITNQNYNVCQVINPDSKMKVLLSGHIDEISLVIEKVESNGTCKLTRNGGVSPYMYAGQHVQVVTKKDGLMSLVDGVVGYTPNIKKGNLEISDLVLDLGTTSKAETLELINIADPVIHMNNYVKLAKDTLSARALDDRLGAFICLEAMKKAKELGCKVGVYASTSVGEETTGRGASVVADMVKPNVAIIVDVTYASDLPYREGLSGDVALGKGPVLAIGSLVNSVVHEKMLEITKKLNMPYQIEVAPMRTYTDCDSMYNRQEGIPCYLISIPLRYMHSSVEVCDLKDTEMIIDLITEFILSLDESSSFDPFK